jgi:hypothetical protein
VLRKLTKKRPATAPADSKGKDNPRMNNSGLDPSQAADILPDVLFHGVFRSPC